MLVAAAARSEAIQRANASIRDELLADIVLSEPGCPPPMSLIRAVPSPASPWSAP